jgi:hypothetical protein
MARMTNTKKVLVGLNVLVILGLASSTAYLFTQNNDLKTNQNLSNEEKNRRLVDEINKVFDLPDEEPVVAVVTDPEEFKKQYAAFDNAESGDYLLFFRKARLNVLYRQDEKRVVKTANVVVPIAVELVGTEKAMAEAENTLKKFGNQITIIKTPKEGITQSFVFDKDDDQKAEAESIAKELGFDIGATLPASITPGAQTEIIIAVAASDSDAASQQP